jgi:uncharacterized membrane protein
MRLTLRVQTLLLLLLVVLLLVTSLQWQMMQLPRRHRLPVARSRILKSSPRICRLRLLLLLLLHNRASALMAITTATCCQFPGNTL